MVSSVWRGWAAGGVERFSADVRATGQAGCLSYYGRFAPARWPEPGWLLRFQGNAFPHVVMKPRKTVRLEPELELIAGELDAYGRRELAMKLFRWVRQLLVSARCLSKQPAPRTQRVPRLKPHELKLN